MIGSNDNDYDDSAWTEDTEISLNTDTRGIEWTQEKRVKMAHLKV